MDIAFYAPLKSPNHTVPSGDRLMARQLIEILGVKGHKVDLVSEFRAFLPEQTSSTGERDAQAAHEVERISTEWERRLALGERLPDLWFTYHLYYKAPDLIGPTLCRRFGIPYVTAEASYSHRRNLGQWAEAQEIVVDAVALAATNICFTERDGRGLAEVVPDVRRSRLFPFIDPTPYLARAPSPEPGRLVAVGMMRPGNKFACYVALAEALKQIAHRNDWHLMAIGDGPMREEVEALFEGALAGRVEWMGLQSAEEVAALLSTASMLTWPGVSEAYGLSYLEAQASGVPVVAENGAGVPEVVTDGIGGILTPPGDAAAYAAAIERLLDDETERLRLGHAARDFVASQRSITAAADRLDEIMTTIGAKDRA